jgi:hypothetical protein
MSVQVHVIPRSTQVIGGLLALLAVACGGHGSGEPDLDATGQALSSRRINIDLVIEPNFNADETDRSDQQAPRHLLRQYSSFDRSQAGRGRHLVSQVGR